MEPRAELLAVGAEIGRETYHHHYAYIKNLEPTQIFFRPNLPIGFEKYIYSESLHGKTHPPGQSLADLG